MLHHREESVARSNARFETGVGRTVEDTHPQVRTHQRVANLEDFFEGDVFLKLHWPIRIDEALKVQAEHVGEAAYLVPVRGMRLASPVRVVVQRLFAEVTVQALLHRERSCQPQRLPLGGNLKIKHVKGLLRGVDYLGSFDVQFVAQHPAKYVAHNTRL